MKPRTNLLVNAACLFVVSPLLGWMVAGIVVGVLEAVIWTLAAVAGLVSSIFFTVNLQAMTSRMALVRQIEIWFIFGGGTIGGMLWSCSEIRRKWKRHKGNGKGW